MRSFKHKGHYGHEGRRIEGVKNSPSWNSPALDLLSKSAGASVVSFVVKKSPGLPR